MDLKTILNRCHHFRGFVYDATFSEENSFIALIRPRKGSRPVCSRCGQAGPCRDRSRECRLFEFVPLWGFKVFLAYHMRRVSCPQCGVVVERVPWADGKNQTCNVYRLFLARWAKRLSWTEVATIFGTSFGVVYRAIEWVVAYGLRHRDLDNVRSIGVDEIAVWTGHQYLTVVYQIDEGIRRLLWVGRERTEESFTAFFTMLGESRSRLLQFVASDMWKPYLNVIARCASQAVHVLDRFHIVANANKAVDEVRAAETKQLAKEGYEPVLKHSRWCFLKHQANLTANQESKLAELMRYNLRSVRAYLLKEALDALWLYKTSRWAGWFLDKWCTRAMRSRLEPFKKLARSLRSHRQLILNWFDALKQISTAAVEGLNTNAKLALRKARGFRTYEALETALYHQLGCLPEPEFTHRFC